MARTPAEIIADTTTRDQHNRPIVSREDAAVLVDAGASWWRERGTEVHNFAAGITTLTRVIIFQGKTIVCLIVVPLEQ